MFIAPFALRNFLSQLCVFLISFNISSGTYAQEVLVAVATNFHRTAEQLSIAFSLEKPEYQIKIASGSTGKLYIQIINGAPFDMFLAADSVYPDRLIKSGLAKPENKFAYATGRLVVLTTAQAQFLDETSLIQLLDAHPSVALANPSLAPYGRAARQVLNRFKMVDIEKKLVFGNSVGQVFSLLVSGAVEIGFVAKSQTVDVQSLERYLGSYSLVEIDENWYDPLQQDAVLLTRGEKNPAVVAFMDFLRSNKAAEIIEENGYLIPDRAFSKAIEKR